MPYFRDSKPLAQHMDMVLFGVFTDMEHLQYPGIHVLKGRSGLYAQ